MAEHDDAGDGGQPEAQPDTGQQGDSKPHGKPADDKAASGEPDKKFTQADLDRKIEERIARERRKNGNPDELKAQKDAAEAGLQQLREDFAKALGFKSDDTPPDPAALQQTVAERESRIGNLEGENRALRVEIAAWRAAGEHGANPVALMDRRSVYERIGALDPTAEDFTTALGQIVKAAVDADETLKAAGVPRTPKPDPSQGSGRPVATGAERGVAEAARRFGNRANVGAAAGAIGTPNP